MGFWSTSCLSYSYRGVVTEQDLQFSGSSRVEAPKPQNLESSGYFLPILGLDPATASPSRQATFALDSAPEAITSKFTLNTLDPKNFKRQFPNLKQ